MLASTGLRIGEALGLQWRHVDFQRLQLRVEQQTTPSGTISRPKTPQSVRDLPLNAWLVQELRRHRIASRFSDDGSPIFASSTGTPLLARNVRERMFRPALEAAGLGGQGFAFHSFRRGYVSMLIAAGIDVQEVSRYAGHSSPVVTLDRYAKEFEARGRSDDKVRDAVASLWE